MGTTIFSRKKNLLRWMGAIAAFMLLLYLYAGWRYSGLCNVPRASCLDHRKAGCSISSEYEIQVGNRRMTATCDMKSDGGGWTLIANYLHAGSPQSTAATIASSELLPLEGSSSLGKDEAGTPHWGHASPELLQDLALSQIRFRCRSGSHSRKVDFVTTSKSCIEYIRSGKGTCAGSVEQLTAFKRNARTLSGHDAYIPNTVDKGWENQGDKALANNPFFVDWKAYWSLGSTANRWECDDREEGGTNSTWHQVWVR